MSDAVTQIALMLALSETPQPTPEQLSALKIDPNNPQSFSSEQVREAIAAQKARDLLSRTSAKSFLGRQVVFMGDDVDLEGREFKRISGVIESARLEQKSQRVIVQLLVKPSQKAPDGKERPVRTDRLDRYPSARLVAHRARDLIGHRVLLHVEMEPMTNGSDQKVRVVKHITDLGMPRAEDLPQQAATPPSAPTANAA